MDSDRWRRLRELFHYAAALDDSGRAELFEQLRDDDPDMRADLVRLFAESTTQAAEPGELTGSATPQTTMPQAAPKAAGPSPGSMVDSFRIIRLLGRGGMGEVHLARDTELGRRVAIKMVLPSRFVSSKTKERFLSEARTTARFNHPNIVAIHAVGAWRGMPYVALEYLEGQDLAARLRERKPSLAETVRIGHAIALALQEAHRHGVLHRDLKPGNVVIPPDGRLRVLDFGLALTTQMGGDELPVPDAPPDASPDAPPDSLPTAAESLPADFAGLLGTPYYMAPEQWLHQPCSEATDTWALGLMLFEMCAGRRPFDGASPGPSSDDTALSARAGLEARMACQRRLVVGQAPAPSLADHAEVPRELVRLVAGCLQKQPKKRPRIDEVVETLRDLLGGRKPHTEEESPFRGLLPFTERHASQFFGRDNEVAAFVERARVQPVLPIVGPSGAGKSSFVQAGVIPRLREQESWVVVRMRPGTRPFEVLAARLSRGDYSGLTRSQSSHKSGDDSTEEHSSSEVEQALAQRLFDAPRQLSLELRAVAEEQQAKVLLFVDQIEKLFTLVDDAEVRSRFMQAVCSAADDPYEPVRVIFVARDDFLARMVTGPEAREALSRVSVVKPLDRNALKQVLSLPVEALGYRYEDPQMVDEMIDAVCGEPACLPLLQFGAQQLWDDADRANRTLQRSSYHAMGGVEGALAKHADGVLDTLTSAELDVARELLLRLVTSERTRTVVSREVALEGLASEAPHVLSRLTQARLVSVIKTRSQGALGVTLELAHESLVHTWTTLSRWIDEGMEDLAYLGEVSQAAELWDKRGRRPDELWRGDGLREARRRLARGGGGESKLVKRFVSAATRAESRRMWRRRGALTALVTFLVGVAVVLALQKHEADSQRAMAERGRDEAQRQRLDAERRRSEALREGARAAVGQGRPLQARAKLRMALELQDSPEARALWWQLSDDPLLWRQPLGSFVYDVAISPDGAWAAAACGDGVVHVFETATLAARSLRGHRDQVFAVSFSPDGRSLASGGWDGEVRLWDLRRGVTTQVLRGHKSAIYSVAFTPDGKRLASSSTDKSVRVWDLVRGKASLVLNGHDNGVLSVHFDPSGRLLASGSMDRTVRLWDARSGALVRELLGHRGPIRGVRFSPNGRLIASSSNDRTVRLWDARSGAELGVLRGHPGSVTRIAFSPDMTTLVATTETGALMLWDLAARVVRSELAAHTGLVWGLAYSTDGTRLLTGSFDYAVALWDTKRGGGPRSKRLGSHSDAAMGVAFASAGRKLVTSSNDRSIRVWDVPSGRVTRVLSKQAGRVRTVAVAPDGKQVASAADDRSVRLLELASGVETHFFGGHRGRVQDVAFSPDGKMLASGGYDLTVRLWDTVKGGSLRTLKGHSGAIHAVRFARGVVASGSFDGSIRLWDPGSGRQLERIEHGAHLRALDISRDGKLLVSGGEDKAVRLWTLPATQPARLLGRLDGRVLDIRFDSNATHIVAACSDGSTHVWNIATKSKRVLRGHSGEVNRVAVSDDGKLIATTSDDTTVRTWQLDSGQPLWRAVAMLHDPPRLLTHRGWSSLDAPTSEHADPVRSNWAQAVQQRARYAEQCLVQAQLMCVQTAAGLEIWDTGTDRQLHARAIDGLLEIRATASGCLARTAQSVTWFDKVGAAQRLDVGAHPKAMSFIPRGQAGFADGAAVVVTSKQVVALSADGRRLGTFPVGEGVTAIGPADGATLALGYRDGGIELLRRGADGATNGVAVSFAQTPSKPPIRIETGPAGTVVVGYASGLLGLWNLQDGVRLAHGKLHGSVVHLRRQGDKLYAATDLGDAMSWDMTTFSRSYCDLLKRVWRQVPVVWSAGSAIQRPVPNHVCRPQ